MAEDYGVSLKITADTSDLDKIQQKVEATRKEIERPVEQTVEAKVEQPAPVKVPVEQPAPVKVPVEQPEPVKPNVEQPAPVKIEAKAEKIRVEVEDAEAKKRIEALTAEEGVKRIRVVTEGGELATRHGGKEIFELEVDAEKAKQTIASLKADARIKVTADTSSAESSMSGLLSNFRKGVSAIRAAISSVFAAFGMVTFVIMGVQALVEGFRKLHDKLTASARAIQQFRFDMWLSGFNAAADAMIGKHQKLLAYLKEEQDVANKAASLRTMETSQSRAQEDQSRQQVRQAALAGATDPRERQRLEDKFSAEDDRIARQRFEQDKRSRLRQLEDEESIYRSKEDGARLQLPKIDEQIANQERFIDIRRKSIASGGDQERDEKLIEEAKKRISALRDEKKQIEELIETMKREADYRAKQVKIVEQSKAPVGNQAVREARARAQEVTDRQAQADFDRQRARTAADAEFDDRFRAAQRRASAPDATEAQRNEAENTQVEMLRGREAEASAELAAAEKKLAEELAKDAKDRDERRVSRAREDIRAAESTATGARRQREDLEAEIESRRAAQSQDYFGNLARQIDASRPKDRLTAMGLGSGSSSTPEARQQARDVHAMVPLLREILEATLANKPDSTAVYAP